MRRPRRRSRRLLTSTPPNTSRRLTCLVKDRDALLTFYDFPAEHWDHLRTSNPIESVFATVRHRTVRTKGALSQDTARLTVFKLITAAAENLEAAEGRKPVAQSCPRRHVHQRRRGHQHASTERRLITASPKFRHSSLVVRGFSGRPSVVRRWAEARRRKEPRGSATSVDVAWQSGCQLARLLMTDPAMLPKAERSLVTHLLDQVPSMADAITVAKRLNALLRRKTSEGLSQILDAATETPLKSFAESLRRDINAIQASLDLPWTTSPVEGQINRLKMLKRTMYGRAGFGLLRARVLHAS